MRDEVIGDRDDHIGSTSGDVLPKQNNLVGDIMCQKGLTVFEKLKAECHRRLNVQYQIICIAKPLFFFQDMMEKV